MKLFIFGSTGDLVKRKVMKSLQELGGEFPIYAIGRKSMDATEYQNFICSDWCNLSFRNRLNYLQVNFDDLKVSDFENELSKDGVNYFYLSLPPGSVDSVLHLISDIKRDGYSVKVLSEKPFGESLESSFNLKRKLENLDLLSDFFVSDHYLFKENFSNFIENFEKMKIVSVEEVGLEGRISYYDSVGALKDMVQSHFLNLVMKNFKFNFNVDNIVVREFVKGQYRGYSEELGRDTKTETYVKLVFDCCGKSFEFVTGKAFSKKVGFVEVDSVRVEMGEDNSYVRVFDNLFQGNFSSFPTVEDSIRGWEIIDKFEKISEKDFEFYEKGRAFE
ncbi:MAG: hypothetical protein JXL97_00290, partial [Bacteroidales bacterium]|nr:hypothetical protein [Bacteroidales bacterium]